MEEPIRRLGENSPIAIAFGKAVKQVRLEKGMTQLDLAVGCQLSRSYVARIEQGSKNPTLSVIWDIAVQLNTSLLELITLTFQNLNTASESQS